jgi:hypothetical protein
VSLLAAVLTGIYLCNVCSCQEIVRRSGCGQGGAATAKASAINLGLKPRGCLPTVIVGHGVGLPSRSSSSSSTDGSMCGSVASLRTTETGDGDQQCDQVSERFDWD